MASNLVPLFRGLCITAGPRAFEVWEEAAGALRGEGKWEGGWGGLVGVRTDTEVHLAQKVRVVLSIPEIWALGRFGGFLPQACWAWPDLGQWNFFSWAP